MTAVKVEPQDDVSIIIDRFGAQLSNPAMPFSILVQFQVKEGMQEKLATAFDRARGPTRQEKGVISFDLNQETSDTTRFVVYERWKSLADLEAHLRTPYITTLRQEMNEMIAGMPDFRVLTPADR